MAQAEEDRHMGMRTLLFVDEIHRFNKAQQDAFLPYVEKGSIILIGATTENPSFEINAALLSRCKVFVLQALTVDDLAELLQNALDSPQGFRQQNVMIEPAMVRVIAEFANGDARTALNTLEMAVLNGEISADGMKVTREILEQCISRKSLLYDKSGEDPLYVARRLIRFASEDVGIADSRALTVAVAAYEGTALWRRIPICP